jgi:AcrR family transcriptional regulator
VDSGASSTTRKRILEAASSVFADEGFAGARVDEIARRASINKAMLYYHVGNKQALYSAVLLRNFSQIEAALTHRVAPDGTAGDLLQQIIAAVSDVFQSNPDHPRIMLREFASGGADIPSEVLGRMLGIFARVRDLLAAGVEGGEFRRTDPVVTHLTVIGASLILNAASEFLGRVIELNPQLDLPDPSIDMAKALGDLLLNGIAATPESGEPS